MKHLKEHHPNGKKPTVSPPVESVESPQADPMTWKELAEVFGVQPNPDGKFNMVKLFNISVQEMFSSPRLLSSSPGQQERIIRAVGDLADLYVHSIRRR